MAGYEDHIDIGEMQHALVVVFVLGLAVAGATVLAGPGRAACASGPGRRVAGPAAAGS